jgi:hypothetical protein
MVRGKNSDLPNGKLINTKAGMDKAVKSYDASALGNVDADPLREF